MESIGQRVALAASTHYAVVPQRSWQARLAHFDHDPTVKDVVVVARRRKGNTSLPSAASAYEATRSGAVMSCTGEGGGGGARSCLVSMGSWHHVLRRWELGPEQRSTPSAPLPRPAGCCRASKGQGHAFSNVCKVYACSSYKVYLKKKI